MLNKLLRLYKDAHWFELGDGFICGTDRITFTIVRDDRFKGFPDGNIEPEHLKKIVKAQSFGCDSGSLWIRTEGKTEWIKLYPSHGFNQKVTKKSAGKATFESDSLAKAIRKIKVTDAQFLVFQGSKIDTKVKIFDSDETFIFEMNVPSSFDQTLLYDWEVPRLRYKWELVKKTIQLKKEHPAFSLIKFGGGIYALWMHWSDCDVYVANHT